MFVATFGASLDEVLASGRSPSEIGAELVRPLQLSGDESTDESTVLDVDMYPTRKRRVGQEETSRERDVPTSSWDGWRDGVAEKKAALEAGKWPDGEHVGRGHGSPYLGAEHAKHMRDGIKVIEGRVDEGVRTPALPLPCKRLEPTLCLLACCAQWVSHVAVNDYITFKISKSFGRLLVVRVRWVKRFSDFGEMVRALGWEPLLPGAGSIDAAIETYRSFANRHGVPYSELEATKGVVAIGVDPLG